MYPKTQKQWREALEALPATPDKIPAFFFAHGSPMLAFPQELSTSSNELLATMGPRSNLASFLGDFGPTLLRKYKPKGIIVFSAHWETEGERLGIYYHQISCIRLTEIIYIVTEYGDENPLLMDYFGFQEELYQLKFKSRGDPLLSERIVNTYKEVR